MQEFDYNLVWVLFLWNSNIFFYRKSFLRYFLFNFTIELLDKLIGRPGNNFTLNLIKDSHRKKIVRKSFVKIITKSRFLFYSTIGSVKVYKLFLTFIDGR